jgi:hypothetical protein
MRRLFYALMYTYNQRKYLIVPHIVTNAAWKFRRQTSAHRKRNQQLPTFTFVHYRAVRGMKGLPSHADHSRSVPLPLLPPCHRRQSMQAMTTPRTTRIQHRHSIVGPLEKQKNVRADRLANRFERVSSKIFTLFHPLVAAEQVAPYANATLNSQEKYVCHQ